MLHVSPQTLLFLRQQQAAADAAERRLKAVAVRKPGRMLTQGGFDQLVGAASLILTAGQPTKFEYEAACRHGLRVSLIRHGWAWSDADTSAALVVGAALQAIGAERPTWKEGQGDFAVADCSERYACARCGKPIDESRKGGNPAKWCSLACGQAAYQARARANGARTERAQYLAELALRKEDAIRERSGPCEVCGTHTITLHKHMRYCSLQCAGIAKRARKKVKCAKCSKVFHPKRDDNKYCSHQCYSSNVRKPRPESSCLTCKTVFRWRQPAVAQSYCSPTCNPRGPKHLRRSAIKCEEVSQ